MYIILIVNDKQVNKNYEVTTVLLRSSQGSCISV